MGLMNHLMIDDFITPIEAYEPIEKLESVWVNPQVKMERSNFSQHYFSQIISN